MIWNGICLILAMFFKNFFFSGCAIAGYGAAFRDIQGYFSVRGVKLFFTTNGLLNSFSYTVFF